jgi:AcrR family transcriptional regulator
MRDADSAERRLLDAVTDLASGHGYGALTVQSICAAAGVSRATLYRHFTSSDDCCWSAYRHHTDRLLAEVARAIATRSDPTIAMLEVLVEFAIQQPSAARLLMSEGLTAGSPGFKCRDDLVARICKATTAVAVSSIDLPPALVAGAISRYLAICLAERTITERDLDDALAWLNAFRCHSRLSRPNANRFWTLPTPRLHGPRFHPPHLPHSPPRRRILDAATVVIANKGFPATTVNDIARTARVSRRAFYNEFPNRTAAATAAYEHGFERALAACAPAYFSAEEWPQRVWHSARALTRFFSRAPAVAYLGFVECFALGRQFERRVHETHVAFTLFLEEGYREQGITSQRRSLHVLTATAIAEIGFLASRATACTELQRMQPFGVGLALTPVLGREVASGLVAANTAPTVRLHELDREPLQRG